MKKKILIVILVLCFLFGLFYISHALVLKDENRPDLLHSYPNCFMGV